MAEAHVLLQIDGRVATITLNRPQALNAIIPPMMDQFQEALERSQGAGVRAVVVTGAGRAFCAGADVKSFAAAMAQDPKAMPGFVQGLAAGLHRKIILPLRRFPAPVLAAVNGPAAGAGLSLALACDLRIAAEEARLTMAYSGIGATADGGSSYYLPRLIGQARAMELYLLNPQLPARWALELGLVTEVVPQADLAARARELAMGLAQGPTWAYRRVKALMDATWNATLEEQLEREADAIGEAAATGDMAEGIRAFVDKRAPQFSGR
jgi:2-(1,2-epoxy-1,2-dihydrophenyl)acetyl-CoA isomerase